MKQLLSLLTILIINLNVFGQKNIFDTLTIDSTTKIIGRYPQYDKLKTYEKYNFIIEDSLKIAQFAKTINLGEEVANSMENQNFRIYILN